MTLLKPAIQWLLLAAVLLPAATHAGEVYQDQKTIKKILVSIPVNFEGYKNLSEVLRHFDTNPAGIIIDRINKSNIAEGLPGEEIGDVNYRIMLPVFFPACVMRGVKMDVLKRNGEFIAKDLVSNYLLNGICKRPE